MLAIISEELLGVYIESRGLKAVACKAGIFGEKKETIELKPAKIDSDFVYLYAFVLFQYWNEWLKYAAVEDTQLASEKELIQVLELI